MCKVARGRGIGCRNGVGGVKDIYIVNYEDVNSGVFTFNEDEVITDIAELTVYHWKFYPGQVSFQENILSDTDQGTVIMDQVLTMNLHGQSVKDRIDINNMARGLVGVFIRDNENTIRFMGLDGGAQVREGNGATGQQKTDRKGYTLTLGAQEAKFANFLEQYTSEPFDNFPNVTVVEPDVTPSV